MSRAVLLLLLLPLPAVADAWPVPRGPAREPVPYRYDPKAVAKLPRDFLDDAVATILYAGTSHLVEPDGTLETITHEVTRLNGRKGVEKLGEYRGILYTPAYQKLTVNEARIHKGTGGVVTVEPRHVHLRDVSTDFQVYDTEKQLIISFPGLEVGDTIEVKWTVRGKNPEHAGQFFTRYAFGDPQYPVALDEVRVRLPKDRELKHASVNATLAPVVTEEAGQKLYTWRTTNRPRLPRDENLPSREELRPTVVMSTFTTWEQVGQWKKKIREECWKCTDEVRNVVTDVTKGLATPADKARALTYWLRRNIRYVSVGERHDFTPHPPGMILANRFGDCKDTSQLLAVMLREAGLRVELATLGALDDGQVHPDVPSPWGTHAILLVTLDGKEHWIDTTSSLAGWDYLPRDDLDRLCYLTDDAGTLRLKRTPPPTPERNRVDQQTTVWVGDDGTSRCSRSVTSFGSAAVIARDTYLEVPPGERRRQLTADLQDANSRTRLVRLRIDDKELLDYDRPVHVRMDFEIPRHFTGSTEREGSFTDSRVWSRLLAYNIDHDRQTPLVLPTPFESLHTYRFHAPSVLAFESVPRDKNVRSKWGSFTIAARPVDGDARCLEVVFHTRLEKVRVEVEELEDFRKFHEDVGREYRVWLTLRPVTEVSATQRLEHLLAVMPHDAPAATTLARIYLKANQLSDAGRVLARATAYHPDDSELWDLRLQACASLEAEEDVQRELVKRYPKKVRHLIGLAGVLISRNKLEEARGLLAPVIEKAAAPNKALAYYQMARSHYRADELNQALEALDLAAKEDAVVVDTVKVHVLRGQVLDELKRPAEAMVAYERALKIDRDNQEVLLALIRLALLSKDERAAVGFLTRYTQAAGKDISGLLLAAETYLRLKRYDEAMDLALRAREVGFHEKGQRILGLVYLQRGDAARAKAHLEKAEPDAVVLAALVQATVALGQAGDLPKLLERAERIDPPGELQRPIGMAARVVKRRAGLTGGTPESLDALACAEELARQKQPYETLLASVLTKEPKLGPAWALEARRLLVQGKVRLAREAAEKAVALSPKEAAAHEMRGRVRLEQGQPAAVEDLTTAAALSDNKDADVLAALAEALAANDRLDAAIDALRAALKVRPKDVALQAQLREYEARRKK